MRIASIPGKLIQLGSLPFFQWGDFVQGWIEREKMGYVPCVLPGSRRMLKIPLRDFYDTYWFFCEDRQGRAEMKFFINQLRAGDVLYDIGAFRGAYAAAAKSRFGDAVTAILFEPLGTNAARIKNISQVNQFSGFEVVAKAVGARRGLTGFIDPTDEMLRAGTSSQNPSQPEMRSVALDEYVEQTDVIPTVIKLDVEGFEFDALEGARQCLSKHRPRIWLELHPNSLKAQGRNWAEAIEMLRSFGYAPPQFFQDYNYPQRELAFHIWCEK